MMRLWRTIRRCLRECGIALVLLGPPLSVLGDIDDNPWTFTAGYISSGVVLAGAVLLLLSAMMFGISIKHSKAQAVRRHSMDIAFGVVLNLTVAVVLVVSSVPVFVAPSMITLLITLTPVLYLALFIHWILRLRYVPKPGS